MKSNKIDKYSSKISNNISNTLKTHVKECNSWMHETETIIDAAVVTSQQNIDIMVMKAPNIIEV